MFISQGSHTGACRRIIAVLLAITNVSVLKDSYPNRQRPPTHSVLPPPPHPCIPRMGAGTKIMKDCCWEGAREELKDRKSPRYLDKNFRSLVSLMKNLAVVPNAVCSAGVTSSAYWSQLDTMSVMRWRMRGKYWRSVLLLFLALNCVVHRCK